MEYRDIGQVHAYLLENRIIETKPKGRKASGVEREMADILIQMNYEDMDVLRDFLSAQGLSIEHFGYIDMPGIPKGGRIWMVLRDPRLQSPQYISNGAAIREIALRENEPIEKTSIWFLHLWLSYLAVIYTHTGRSVSEVSGYIDTFFRKEQIISAVTEHIEQIRAIGIPGGVNEKVFDALDSEKGKDIPRRVSSFLKLLENSRLIVSTGDEEYQQTLLGGAEMAKNYTRSLGNIIPENKVLENIVSIVTDGQIQGLEEV